MGRKVKKGLDYFPLYHDFFTSKKIKALRRAHGSVGILTYLNILCKVYDRGYFYRFDNIDELAMDISEEIANAQLRATATGVTETINYLVGQGILDEGLFKRGIISGVALQEQYVISSYKAKRKIEMDVFCLLQKNEEGVYVSGSTPEKNISSEEMPISTEEIQISTEESTQRERKEEGKIKDFSSFLSIAREQGQIVLSDKELSSLKAKILVEDLRHYVEAIIACERDGKKYKKKSHYQAIVDMAKADDKYDKPLKSYDLEDFFEAALSKTMEELK